MVTSKFGVIKMGTFSDGVGSQIHISKMNQTMMDDGSGTRIYTVKIMYQNNNDAKNPQYPEIVLINGYSTTVDMYSNSFECLNEDVKTVVMSMDITDLKISAELYVHSKISDLHTEMQNHPDDLNTAFLNWYGELVKLPDDSADLEINIE